MIRFALGLVTVALLFGAVGMFRTYGEVEPCRALAVERARHAAHGLPVAGAIEHWTRIETSQKSSGQCARELVSAWLAKD
ncbi:MAG: hypothetical protein ACREHE_13365 [Rhizomicrobium sp.]